MSRASRPMRARLALTCEPTSLWVGMAFLGMRKVWRQWKLCRCLLSKLKHRLPFRVLIYSDKALIPRIPGNAWSCAQGRIQRIARKGVSFIGVRWQPSQERRGRQPRGGPYTHRCIRKDDSLWIRNRFTAFRIELEMNFNPSAIHLQIRARLLRSSAPESAPGYGSALLKVELPSRKV